MSPLFLTRSIRRAGITRRFLWLTQTLLAAVVLQAAPPAELVLNTRELTPTTTFELRFTPQMVASGAVGQKADPPPIEMVPAVPGQFVWLSTRSGVFTPSAPLPLGTTFRFVLRPEVIDVDGASVAGELEATIETPGFALKGWHPAQWFRHEDAPAEPAINLLFNADVNAADTERLIQFTNGSGEMIPARVVQADALHHPEHTFPRYRSNDRSLLTWEARFQQRATAQLGERPPTIARGNQLFVRPAQPLRVGTGWKLVLAGGLPAADGVARLVDSIDVPIGEVKPFVVKRVAAENDGTGDGRRVEITFSKAPSAELTAENFARWITVTPTPKQLAARLEGRQLTLIGGFELATEYQVEIAAGLPAAESFTLAEAVKTQVNFEPIPASLALESFATHQLSTGTRRFLMRGVNVPRLRVSAKVFQPETLPLALTAYDEYFQPPQRERGEGQRKIDPAKIAGTVVFSRSIVGTEQVDAQREIALAWDEILGPGKTGVVLITAEEESAEPGERPGVQAIVQVTDLGVVWKTAKDETFVHVFSLATGAPIAGAKVQLVSEAHASLGEVTTDDAGAARLPATAEARWILAQRDADLHLVPIHEWENRLSLYRFRIPHHGFDDEQETGGVADGRQMFFFAERGVYRPGETAFLKAIIRDTRAGQPRIPAGEKASIKAFDDRDREIFSRDFAVSALGSVEAEIPLPKATLGTYRATITLGEGEAAAVAGHTFEVQEYTPNAFEITIETPRRIIGAVPLELPVAAQYYMGKKLSKAQLAWSLQAEDESFEPEGFDGFTFGAAISDDRLSRALDRESHFADQGKLELGADGRSAIVTTVQLNPKAPQPRRATLLCEMTDLNQQTVSQSRELTWHSSDFYLGLAPLPTVVRAGDKLPLSLVAVRTDGTPNPEAVPATVRLTRVDWQNNRVVTDEESSEFQSEPIFTLLSEHPLLTQLPEKAEHQWTAPAAPDVSLIAGEPGLYLLEAAARDAAGREVLTSTTFYVTGENVTEWNYRNEIQIELVADKPEYLSGETARVLVKTPIAGDALVTIERDRVLRSFVTRLSGNAPAIELPLTSEDAPNVFVSVMLLRGAEASPRKFKEPDYRVGYCQLKVTRPETKLAVYLTPERKGYQPGDTVSITAEVRDHLGAPAAGAEVTLYAVDEGVLSLTGYTTPEPLVFFNQALPLVVRTSLSLPSLLREDPDEKSFENKGYMIGGGGDLGAAFRKNFVTCAYWNGTLRTDEQGRVTARFTAPDSLTRYRVIAVVQTAADAFGGAESAFEVSKPVMLEPSLPRFANVGDQLLLRGVLHNLTDIPGEAEVLLELDGTATAAVTKRRITLPARGSVAVDFPVEFRSAGEAKWKWTARFTGGDGTTAYRDAVQTTLKVGFPVAEMREVHFSRIESAETDLLAKVNPTLLEGVGKVRVSLGNTRAVELRESLEQLLHYPYGCVEQTTSSTLPWIVMSGLRGALPELARTDSEVRSAVLRGVDRLFSMQTADGGLAYWPGGRETNFWGTAYGGLCLALAQRGGFEVPADSFDRVLKLLSSRMRGASGDSFDQHYANGGPSDRCLALYALAVAGRSEPAYHELLFQRRAELSAENRALLALAIAESRGPAPMIQELLQPGKTPGANAEDPFWSSSRDSAIRLLAWGQFQPGGPAAEALAVELFERRQGGHWITTQGNCWALLALKDYLLGSAKPGERTAGALGWGGAQKEFSLTRETPASRFDFPLQAASGRSTLRLQNPGRARLFAEVEIRAVPRTLHQPRQDQGFAVERSYAKVEDDGSLVELSEPRVGDRVLITLRIEASRNARYVAVNDPLPAIFEAVNPVFKSQATRAGEVLGREWEGDFQELRDDRALFFADYLRAGSHTIRYLARVRAAGTATAPSAKVEEMYHPERFGTTATLQLTSLPLP